MGTEYSLYKKDGFELTIDEMSNKLTFCLDPNKRQSFSAKIYTSDDMTPEEMAKIFLKGLTVCSYWMDTDELKNLIQNHMCKEIY